MAALDTTDATFIRSLRERGYIRLEGYQVIPTERGQRLHDYLATHFTDLFRLDFHIQLEADLDAVATGKLRREDLLDTFWSRFQPLLAQAAAAFGPTAQPLHLRPVAAQGG